MANPRRPGRFAAPDDDKAVCSILASGPHTPHNFTHDALFLSLAQAKRRVYITTPYLIPEESTFAALRTAVYRGVDVRLLVPSISDAWIVQWAGRSYYPDLLSAGIRLYEYLPTILHAKSVVIDDDLSIVGSANIDVRSFRLNFEASCLTRSKPLAHRLLDLFSRISTQPRSDHRRPAPPQLFNATGRRRGAFAKPVDVAVSCRAMRPG